MHYRSLLIVCLATLGLAVAGWGQADGKIAFLSDREEHNDVWIMNADGSDRREPDPTTRIGTGLRLGLRTAMHIAYRVP